MDNNITIRIKSTPEIIEKAKKYASEVTKLSHLTGSFWKPVGTDLKDFHPSEVVVRLRSKKDGSSKAEKIVTKKDGASYTHENKIIVRGTKENCWLKLVSLKYEPWVEYDQCATEYTIKHNNTKFIMLNEIFNDKSTTLKFETNDENVIWAFLEEFNINKVDVINKNTAELLAENLI